MDTNEADFLYQNEEKHDMEAWALLANPKILGILGFCACLHVSTLDSICKENLKTQNFIIWEGKFKRSIGRTSKEEIFVGHPRVPFSSFGY